MRGMQPWPGPADDDAQEGFTLIELMVVVLIIAILIAIAIGVTAGSLVAEVATVIIAE